MDTRSAKENRINVTINDKNEIKSITFYDEKGKRWGEIHDANHHGLYPHIHIGYDKPHTDDNTRLLNKKEKKILNKVKRYWREFNG